MPSKTRTRAQQLAVAMLALLLMALLGFYTLVTGRITDGSAKLNDGAGQAAAGAQQLKDGAGKLAGLVLFLGDVSNDPVPVREASTPSGSTMRERERPA